ncbi:MAG: riboflavin biosynthesis protein RibF [Nitrospirota bacterium]
MTAILRQLPDQPLRNPLVAIGNFDGVHLGHQAIICEVARRARAQGGTSVVLTFDPHPMSVVRPEVPLSLLTGAEQKIECLTALGVDVVLALPFTPEFARRSAEQFVREDLGARLGAREVHVGRNFKFGKGREGRVEDLERLGASSGMRVMVRPSVMMGETMVSSSEIRNRLRDGDVEGAAAFLGRVYAADGVIEPGEGRGRALGYATANFRPGVQMLPKIGIYAAVVDDLTTGERELDGVVYIGSQPTFGPHPVQGEVHLFGKDTVRYNHRLRVAFLRWIRGEQRFADSQALIAQIERDVAAARTALAERRRAP